MKKKDFETISAEIWRAGFVKDKNKVSQEAKECTRRLISYNLASKFSREKEFDEKKFLDECGL